MLYSARQVVFVFFVVLLAGVIGFYFIFSRHTESRFYGVNWHPIWIDSGGQNFEMDLMQEAGVRTVRLDVPWYSLEPSKGSYEQTYLNRLDNAINGLASRGIDPLVVVTTAPDWATGAPSGDPDPESEPPIRTKIGSNCNPSLTNCKPYNAIPNYDHFLSFLMKRWIGKVHEYEVWNEPNGQWSWISAEPDAPAAVTDDAIDYVMLLKSAYVTAKAIDPSITILAGSLSGTDSGPQEFLTTMYRHGAKGYFDVLSQHYYCDPPGHNYCSSNRADDTPATLAATFAENIVPIMKKYGDGSKAVWITETGYNASSDGVSVARQSTYLSQTFKEAKKLPNVARLYWFTMDGSYSGSSPENYYGLIKANMSNANSMPTGYQAEPAYTAFKQLAKS